MLSVVVDMARRCSRDEFFLSDGSIVRDIVEHVTRLIAATVPNAERSLLRLTGTVPGLIEQGFDQVFDACGAPAVAPEEAWDEVLSFVRARTGKTDGRLLYLNPLQGIITSRRIRLALERIDTPGIHVSAGKTPSNMHPLWVCALPMSQQAKHRVVLNSSQLKASNLRNDKEAMRQFHDSPQCASSGSQHLPDAYQVDAALIASNVPSPDFGVPLPAELVPWDGKYDRASDLPWVYSVPVFTMHRDTKPR